MSLLGAGSFVPFAVFTLQVAIPVVLVIKVVGTECNDEGDFLSGKVMALIVYVLYFFTVIPNTFMRFYEVEGGVDTVYSRLLSLRRELWVQGDDSITQMIGFKLDIIMSTAYECALSMLNILVIRSTYNAMDVILNALAFTFIALIDQEIVKSAWWDPKNRWVTAGSIEVIMSSTVRLRWISSATLFEHNYGIPEDSITNVCNGDKTLLLNHRVAKEDASKTDCLTKQERILQLFSEVSEETNNPNAMDEYKKPNIYFGVFETAMGRFGYANPVFTNFKSYRTWSRWNKVLFLAPVPDLDDLFETDESGNTALRHSLGTIVHTKDEPFANFYPDEDGVSKKSLLFRHMRGVLKMDLIRGLGNSVRRGQNYVCFRVIFHLMDTLLQLCAYLFQIILPVFLSCVIIVTIYELLSQQCVNTIL